MSDFLPPVVLKLVGDISNLVTKLAEASAALNAFARTAPDQVGPGFERDMGAIGHRAGAKLASEAERGAAALAPGIKRQTKKAERELDGFFKKIMHFIGSMFPGGGRAMAVGITSLIYGLAQLIAALGPLLGIINIAAPGIAALVAGLVTLKMAFHGVGTALAAFGKGDMAAFNEALAKMPPNMRAAVRAMAELKPALDNLRATVQQNFWAGFANHIRLLGANYFPMLRQALGGVALDLGNSFKWLMKWLNQRGTIANMATMFAGLRRVLADSSMFLMKLLVGFINLIRGGMGPLADITGKLNKAGDRFIEWTDKLASSGRIKQLIDNSLPALKLFWDILKLVGQGLSLLTKALNAAGQAAGGAGGAGGLLVQMVSALVGFLKTAEGMDATIQIFTMMNKIFTLLGGVFAMFLRLAIKLLPIVEPLIDGLVAALTVFIQALEAGLGPALIQIVAALTPAVVALSNALLPVLVALTPLIVAAAGVLSTVLVSALVALTPLIIGAANALAGMARWLTDHETLAKNVAVAITAYVIALKVLRGALLAAAIAQTALDLAAAPWLLIAVAIIAVVAAIVLIATKTTWFQTAWNATWGGAKRVFHSAVEAIKAGFAKLKALPGILWQAIQKLPGLLRQALMQAAYLIGYALGYGIGLAVRAVIEGVPKLIAGFLSLLSWFKEWSGNAGRALYRAGWDLIVNLGRGLANIHKLPGMFWDLLLRFKDWSAEVGRWMYTAGVDMIWGLLKGIASMFDTAWDAVWEFGRGLIKGFNDAVGNHSPSKIFARAGSNIVAGLVLGITRDAAKAKNAVTGLLAGVGGGGLRMPISLSMAGPAGGIRPSFAGGGGGTVVVHLANTTTLDGKVIQRSQVTHAQRYKRRNGETGLT